MEDDVPFQLGAFFRFQSLNLRGVSASVACKLRVRFSTSTWFLGMVVSTG